MELRTYWGIFVRRWWIAAVLTGATAVISFLTSPLTQSSYTATMRVLLSVPSERPTGSYFTYDRYYSLLSTEYVTDDFIEVTRSRAFLEDVKREMGGALATPLTIQSQPRAERAPRILTLTVTAGDRAETQRAAEAAVKVLTTRAGEYFAQLGSSGLMARVIDPPAIVMPSAGGRNYLNLGLRTLLGLFVGLGLTFLLHYLDTTLYDTAEVEQYLGLPVLAEIPAYKDAVPAGLVMSPRAQEAGVGARSSR